MTFSGRKTIPMVLTSKDPSFAGLFENASQGSPFQLQTTAGPAITLETVRSNSPELVLIDLDSVELSEASRLVLKLTLVSNCCIVLTGTEAVPGIPSMDALVLAGAHGLLVKPQGKTSLCLAVENGAAYLADLGGIHRQFAQRRPS
jgi:AmiR/NasT family two-component response regulator